MRFADDVVARLVALHVYQWDEKKFAALRPFLCQGDIDRLLAAAAAYDASIAAAT